MKYFIIFIYLYSTTVYAGEVQKFPTKECLTSEIIRSINAKDKQGLLDTFHPLFINAINSENNSMFNHMIEKLMSYNLDPISNLEYGVIEPTSVTNHYKGKMSYPVNQNGSIWIKNSKDIKYTNVSIHISTSHDIHGWYQVFGVPTKKYAAEYIQSMEKHEAFELKVQNIVRNMNKELRKDIMLLLKNNDFFKALELYMTNMKADKRLSQQVVRQIRKEEGLENRL